jgi:putative endonuclease
MWWLWGRAAILDDPRRLGQWGQRQAEKYLRRKGYRLLTRNYRIVAGELDLVFTDDDGRVVFTEVKTRADEKFASATSAVNYKKRLRLIKAARSFVRKYKLADRPLRFDVAVVIVPPAGAVKIRHYTNVFVP